MNQECLKPQDKKREEERFMVDKIRGTPLTVANLEEIIDDEHAIVSPQSGNEWYVPIYSIVDMDQLEPNCSVLLKY